jgi:hypothetical protein
MKQMKDMEHVVTHKSHFDQFMEIGDQSPFIFLVIVLTPICLVFWGLYAVWVGLKHLFGFA